MIDPDDTKFRITWPAFCKDGGEDGAEGKSKKCRDEDPQDCGCCSIYPCREWCAGVKAFCVSCAEALSACPRCTCYRVRCACGRLGHGLGRCLAGCSRLLGFVFSAIVTLVGCLGMALVVYYLWPAIVGDEDVTKTTTK